MERRIEEFIDHLIATGYAENTVMAYRGDLSQLSGYLRGVGLNSWDEVREKELINYVLFLREREYALSTVARKVASARSFFAFLVSRGLLKDNPAAGLSMPLVQRSSPGEAPSMEEVDRLLATVEKDQSPKGLRDRALLGLLVEAGLRPSEVVSLNVEDVNTMELSPKLKEAIHRYLEEGRPRLVAREEERALFLSVGVGIGGSRLTRQGAWLIVKERGKAAGLDDLSPRLLRRVHIHHRNWETRDPEC